MSAVCVSVVCLVLGREGGLELEVGVLAFADAPEVGFLVEGDAVVADVQGRQCPIGGQTNSKRLGKWSFEIIARKIELFEHGVDRKCIRECLAWSSSFFTLGVVVDVIAADIQTRQRPLGDVVIGITANNSS